MDAANQETLKEIQAFAQLAFQRNKDAATKKWWRPKRQDLTLIVHPSMALDQRRDKRYDRTYLIIKPSSKVQLTIEDCPIDSEYEMVIDLIEHTKTQPDWICLQYFRDGSIKHTNVNPKGQGNGQSLDKERIEKLLKIVKSYAGVR